MKGLIFLICLAILVATSHVSEGKHLHADRYETALAFKPLIKDVQAGEKDYLKAIYAHFRHIFWTQANPTRQFAVVTIEKLTHMPTDDADDFPLDHPGQYNADFWSNSQPDHTEVALLRGLTEMILDDLRAEGHLPANVYLFTYNIPCPRCTALIENFIEHTFPNALNDFVTMNPCYAAARLQIKQMTYRIGWTLEPNADDAHATIHTFHDINDDADTSHLAMYPKITL